WRYLKEQGVPMIGGGFDGSYYYNAGNENIVSALGTGTPVPGLTYDTVTREMKKLGATKVAAVGYGASASSSESAKATETFGAKAAGLESGYITCDIAILGLTNAGKNPTRQSFVDGIRNNGANYDGAGLMCAPTDLSSKAFGTISPTSCSYFLNFKNGKFNVLNGGKPLTGKLVGDPDLIKQYTSGAGTGVTTTTAAPAS